ncbi:nucleoside hydrolase [Agromyces sp. SYSU T00266]|uniref:nucleoside hydrolase n=1 Tax=Agromyces zhanjiangensis TaxID=3158562 RepID=UPI00339613F5
MNRSIVIDSDTASDDAVALLQAILHPAVEIRAVTTVAGNVPLETATRNALLTLELGGASDVPVHPGCAKPLLRALETAQHVHGEDGMSGAPLHSPVTVPQSEHAVEALLRLGREEPGMHELVTLGPLTNVAAALLIEPELLTRFTRVTMMIGAADARGNIAPTGEFNAWADPEAASIVFEAPGDKYMVGWDASRKYAVITDDDEAELRATGRFGEFLSDINRAVRDWGRDVTGIDGYDLPDPLAMAVAIDPSIVVESELVHVAVSTDGSTRGQTYADHRLPLRTPNVTVVTAVRPEALKHQLLRLFVREAEAVGVGA